MKTHLSSPLKWHGGKHYLATKIRQTFPKHLNYVEPFAGGLSVLLSGNGEGVSEVVNDLDRNLWIFWKVLQRPSEFYSFQRVIEATPFSEDEWIISETDFDNCPNDIEVAVDFFIRCRQSLAGRMESFASITKNRTRRGMNEQVSAWLDAIEGLAEVHARLKRVLILNREATDVIRELDTDTTLFYIDPPYVHESRTSKNLYRHEMSDEQHIELITLLKTCKGMVAISGYHTELYDSSLSGWNCHEFNLPNNASGGSNKRRMTEVLWTNY